MIARPRIRQLGLGELLDESFRLYRANFLTFITMAALVLVPYQIISFLVQLPIQNELAGLVPQPGANPTDPLAGQSPLDVFSGILFWYLGIIAISLLYVVVFLPLLEGALTHAVAQRYLGRSATTGESFGAAIRRSPALIGARLIPTLFGAGIFLVLFAIIGVLAFLVIRASASDTAEPSLALGAVAVGFLGVGLTIVLTVVALALYVRIFFTSQAIMVEDQGPWQAIKRSWRLTQRYFWRTVGYLLVIILLMYFLASLPAIVLIAPTALLGIDQRLQLLLQIIVTTIFSVIATPFSLIAYTLMYFDLRIRKEGFDLEQQTNTLLAPGTSSPYISSH